MQNLILVNMFVAFILTNIYLEKYKKLKKYITNIPNQEMHSYTKLLVVYGCSIIIFFVMLCLNVMMCKALSFDSKAVIIEQQVIFLLIIWFTTSFSKKNKELLLKEKREFIMNFGLIALLSFCSFLGIFFQ